VPELDAARCRHGGTQRLEIACRGFHQAGNRRNAAAGDAADMVAKKVMENILALQLSALVQSN
jgi:hypothetical protein